MASVESSTVRRELVDLIDQEVLGPRDGVDEEIPASPRARYALGGLAPVTVDPNLGRAGIDHYEADFQSIDGSPVLAVTDSDPGQDGQFGVPVPTDEDISTAE